VHVYDRHDRAGGLLVYGIPGFKLEKEVVTRRIERLRASGIQFHDSFEIGRNATLAQLRERHDAILVATGVYKARAIRAPGVGSPGIVKALDYLIASNRKSFGDTVPDFETGVLNAKDKHVVVVGGGDTAMDCVRTAVRQGAKSVKSPLPPRSRQHAGLAARGRQCRGRRCRVRLALRARGVRRGPEHQGCACLEDAARCPGRLRPPRARARSR
jgi:NADPH-dependent glutamate synthase beta chain and related oxidoreductases